MDKHHISNFLVKNQTIIKWINKSIYNWDDRYDSGRHVTSFAWVALMKSAFCHFEFRSRCLEPFWEEISESRVVSFWLRQVIQTLKFKINFIFRFSINIGTQRYMKICTYFKGLTAAPRSFWTFHVTSVVMDLCWFFKLELKVWPLNSYRGKFEADWLIGSFVRANLKGGSMKFFASALRKDLRGRSDTFVVSLSYRQMQTKI